MKSQLPKQHAKLLSIPQQQKANSQASPNKQQESSSPSRSNNYRDGNNNSSSGTNSQSQSHLFHNRDNFSNNDGTTNRDDSFNNSTHNASRQSAVGYMPQPVVSFEINEHDILKKQDYVVYHLSVNTKTIQWTVQLRYNNFKDLNDCLHKNHLYKEKVPSFPPKRFMRKSKEVIEERKKLLAEYMNTLSTNINIFRDEAIVGFLKQDWHSIQISNLADLQEKFISDLNELSSYPKNLKKSGGSSFNAQTLKELKSLQGEQNKKRKNSNLKISTRKRGQSDEHNLFIEENFSPLTRPTDQWSQRKFENIDERLKSWLEEMHKNVDNQSQLILDLQDYYFGEKPLIPVNNLKMMFYGYLKHRGLLDHLKECHLNTNSLKTKTIMNFMVKLLDFNKSHQIEDISQIWQTVRPFDIKECHFELMMDGQQSIKEAALTLLKVYLDGKLFKVSDLINDEKFAQKFHVWQTNKNRHQNSFSSQTSLGANSHKKNKRASINSVGCPGQPHFGPCNHSNTSRVSQTNESPNQDGINQLQIVKSASSRCLQPYKQRSCKVGPKRNISENIIHSAHRHTEKTHTRQNLTGQGQTPLLQPSEELEDDDSGPSLASDDDDYLFQRATQLERKKNKRQSVQVTVPREIVSIKRVIDDEQDQNQEKDQELVQDEKLTKKEVVQNQVVNVESATSDNTKFDLRQEIQDLIKHYNRRFNLIYHTPQIEDLETNKVLGQVNQYIFEQSKIYTSYKLKLSNFRKLIEGMRPHYKGKGLQQSQMLAPAVSHFFADLNCEVVKVIDENNKLIRYSFKRKISLDFDQYMQESQQTPILKNQRSRKYEDWEEQEHLMLVSYQITGLNKDKASISLFEFDEEKNRIVPSNFIIVTQTFAPAQPNACAKTSFSSMNSQNTFDSKVLSNQVGTSNTNGAQAGSEPTNFAGQKTIGGDRLLPTTSHNFDMYRTLSAVTEDCDGEELGSISINATSILGQARTSAKKSQQLAQKQSLLLMNRFGASPQEQDDEDEIIRKESKGSKSEDEESDQDKLLFESTFIEEKGRANSFHSDFEEENSKQEESSHLRLPSDQQRGQCSAKASFSTSKSSNADVKPLQWINQSNVTFGSNHQFDEILRATHGDVSVIMRISEDERLLTKILSLFKGLANQINLSLHGIKQQ